ncbi:hypothetical protein [Epilithonimonas arachidiradicis]|uniref:Uncharacterized protein n=1 Tax=Epilithonimonas arachidiradicis TaxID=1617282 RepID=A0A420DDQ2_9FLAO|nr:hypothetical protein [Epilithonimonas arachidiradicis]RKE90040.1 hypothetical protein BXY58_0625 [Epilithonimonas arachidiradicis]GGG47260.1 hypothetical protein GCM10007332_05970 [Epilithonimonas arachidiradicis]
MAKQQFKNGEKAKVNCTLSQLLLLQITGLQPGDEIYIVRKSFRDKDRDFYIVNPEPLKTEGQTIPENYLTKIE